MDLPNPVPTEDFRLILVTDNTLLGSLLSSQLREIGGLSVQVASPAALEERGIERIEKGTALLLDSSAFNRLFAILAASTAPMSIIVIADQISLLLVRKVLEIGGKGIIPTDFAPDLFRLALMIALRGETFFPSAAWLPMLRMSTEFDPGTAVTAANRPAITWREREILNQLFLGISNKMIAYNLGITEATVKMHMSNLSRKLDAQNRTQILVNAMKFGFVSFLAVS
jgi:DNA-binding NarL/FixJ family response regulator